MTDIVSKYRITKTDKRAERKKEERKRERESEYAVLITMACILHLLQIEMLLFVI